MGTPFRVFRSIGAVALTLYMILGVKNPVVRYAIVLVIALLAILPELILQFQIHLLRKSGSYPQPGKATLDDVRRFRDLGNMGLAMRLYREIHGGSLGNAKSAVQSLSQP